MGAAAARSQAVQPAPGGLARPGPVRRSDALPAPPPIASLSAVPAWPAVQRKCAACEAKEREELPVQPRLEVGPAGDAYEREADGIAATVMAMREGEAASAGPSVQRKCAACEAEDTAQRASALPTVQRQCAACAAEEKAQRAPCEDDLVRPRRATESLKKDEERPVRRETEAEEDEVRARRQAGTEEAEEDEVRARRKTEAEDEDLSARRAGGDPAVETGLAASAAELTGGGSPLPEATRRFYEPRMGRKLSAVRVHRGDHASRLNRSIAARAFTYRDHIWLGPNEGSAPSFTMAHELAHVMQQTSPGPVGPAAGGPAPIMRRAGHDVVRRFQDVAFWEPLGGLASARARHTTMHNIALAAISKKNPALITEAPIPGGSAKGTGSDRCGFVDLYKSDTNTVPGVEVTPPIAAAPPPAGSGGTPPLLPAGSGGSPPLPPPTPAAPSFPLNNFTASEAQASCKDCFPLHPMKQNGSPYLQSKNRWPRITKPKTGTPYIHGWDKAPGTVWMGDLKPGHNVDERLKGVTQVQNYIQGITNTANEANKVAPAGKSWNLQSVDILKSNQVQVPDKWDPGATNSDWPVGSLRLRLSSIAGSKTFYPWGSRGATRKTAIRGRWVIAKDKKYNTQGIWTYFLQPHPDDLAAAMARNTNTQEFKNTATSLERVLGCLTASPTSRKKLCKRPASAPAHGPAATTSGPRVQRTTKPKKTTDDSFSFARWNALRMGSPTEPAHSKGNLKETLDQNFPEELRDQIKFKAAAVQSIEEFDQNYVDHGVSLPKHAKELGEQGALIERAEFWTSPVAAIFGRARAAFGDLYVRGANMIADAKLRLRKHFREQSFHGGPSGTIGKMARTVAKVVLGTIGRKVTTAVTREVSNCIEAGFTAKMQALVSGSQIDELTAKAKSVEAAVDKIKEDTLTEVEPLIESVVGDVKTQLSTVAAKAKLILDIAQIAVEAAKVARIGSCIAGLAAAPETVGVGAVVGCGIALGDWILSKFGLSPFEFLAATLLKSCDSQRLVAKTMLAIGVLKQLPTDIARWIVTQLRGALANTVSTPGFRAEELLCDPSTIAVRTPKESEIECARSYKNLNLDTVDLDVPSSVPLKGEPGYSEGGDSGGQAEGGGGSGAGQPTVKKNRRIKPNETGTLSSGRLSDTYLYMKGLNPNSALQKGSTHDVMITAESGPDVFGPSPINITFETIDVLDDGSYVVTFKPTNNTILVIEYIDETTKKVTSTLRLGLYASNQHRAFVR